MRVGYNPSGFNIIQASDDIPGQIRIFLDYGLPGHRSFEPFFRQQASIFSRLVKAGALLRGKCDGYDLLGHALLVSCLTNTVFRHMWQYCTEWRESLAGDGRWSGAAREDDMAWQLYSIWTKSSEPKRIARANGCTVFSSASTKSTAA